MTPSDRRKSTTDRVALWRLQLLRVAFAVLEQASPALGARWAVRLWCRPPDPGSRRRDDRPGPGTLSRLDAGGSPSVVVETWGHGPPVYLIHGWGGWRGQLGAFVEPLVTAGYRAVAVDVPSHGDSGAGAAGPGRSTMVEFAETLTALVRAHGPAAGVIAHSMGGAAAALAARDGLAIPRAVLVAPAADPLSQTAAFADVLRVGPRTHRRMLAELERIAGRPIADFDARTLPRHLAPAALVIHDRHDREVEYGEGVAIAEAWPAADLLTTESLGHRRVLRDPAVVQAAVDYLGRATWVGDGVGQPVAAMG